jgi:hypothetical protein
MKYFFMGIYFRISLRRSLYKKSGRRLDSSTMGREQKKGVVDEVSKEQWLGLREFWSNMIQIHLHIHKEEVILVEKGSNNSIYKHIEVIKLRINSPKVDFMGRLSQLMAKVKCFFHCTDYRMSSYSYNSLEKVKTWLEM